MLIILLCYIFILRILVHNEMFLMNVTLRKEETLQSERRD